MSEPGRQRLAAGAAVAVIAAVLVLLARGLPAATFYAGDPGVKLIAARHAIAHPSNPSAIPLPAIGGAPVDAVDPFFVVHGDHSHPITSALFPLVSAPFIALFGLRGAYLLPAVGLLLALAAAAALAVRLDPGRRAAGVVVGVFLAMPLLFYGLEFWEHTLAAGFAVWAAALFVRGGWTGRRLVLTGVLFGIAALLRPEALWFAVAVLACSRLLPSPPPRRTIAIVAAGVAAALAPLELYTLAHFGSLVPQHLAGNPAVVSGDWMAVRRTIVSSWFLSTGTASLWRAAPALALAPLALARGAGGGRLFLLAVALVDTGLVVFTAPNDGGSQWGPRYLLLAGVPLAILTTDVCISNRTFAIRVALVGIVVLGSAWVQRAAYLRLRGAKLTYARMVDFVAREAPAGGYVVTDIWWLDQAAAAIADTRRFLYVPDAGRAAFVMGLLDRAGEQRVTLLRSRVESPGAFEPWLERTCYAPARQADSPEGLVAIEVARTC
jgi:hypothetical protein